MKSVVAVVLALIVGGGVGYGAFEMMGKSADPQSPESIEAAQNAAAEVSNVEPAAAEKTPSADDPVVAKVDGKTVLRSDVLDFIKTLPPQMQQVDPKQIFPMALEQVISGKIVDEKAMAEGLANDAEVQKRLAEAKVQIIRATYAEKAVEKEFSADKVKKAYDDMVAQMPKVDEVKASHILVDDEAKAKEIIGKLKGGAKFEDLAKEFSKDQSNSASGGDLGFFGQSDMVKEFSDAAFKLNPNEFSQEPVKTQFGFHVIKVTDKRVRPAPNLDDIKTQLEGQVRRDILNGLVETWRKGSVVEQFDWDGNPLPKAEEKPAEAAPSAPAPAEEKKAE
jgi:peptidyl-prolyl cis-trans isomerase C